jgi:hypothetical protein
VASILDNVKRGLSQPAEAPQLGSQQQAQALARATTGKAIGGGGTTPQLSEQQQAAAQQDTMAAQRAVTAQGQDMASKVQEAEKQIETQTRQQRRRLNEKEVALKEQAAQKVDEVLTNYVQSKGRLDLAKDKAQAEQVGFMMRLTSEQYIHKLQVEGAKSRLNNGIEFREALQRAMFDEERKLLDENLHFKQMIGNTRRDFKEQAAEIDLDMAIKIAEAEAKSANEQMKWQAIGGLATSAIKLGGAVNDLNATKTTDTSPTPTTWNDTSSTDGWGLNATSPTRIA